MKLKQRAACLIAVILVGGSLFTLIKRHKAEKIALKLRDVPGIDDDAFHSNIKRNAVFNPIKLAEVGKSSMPNTNLDLDMLHELNRLHLDMKNAIVDNYEKSFQIAADWVNERQIYPHNHPELVSILKIMATAKIEKADVLPKGTQIKLLLTLKGGQRVVFKQKRYARNDIIEGKPYSGYDRHNGEVAAFHLDRLFDFRRSPLVVGRKINLKKEIMPVASKKLLETFRNKDGNLCYFSVCLYCKEKHMACADGEIMEGALTLWLPEQWSQFEKHRHPFQRTYREGYLASWEKDETYCNTVVKKKPPYDYGPRLLDVTDGCVFDYLIGNADRHHYETFKGRGRNAMLIMMDNAKSFGNPHIHEASILAPIRQCCLLRNSTWDKMKHFRNGVLTQLLEAAMESDPIAPVLHSSHLQAMDHRLTILLNTMEDCIKRYGRDKVIVNEWKGLS